MKRFIQVGVVLLMLIYSHVSSANVLNFDGIETFPEFNQPENQIKTNYGGFTWHQDFYVIHESWVIGTTGGAWRNTQLSFPSSSNAAYNSSGTLLVSMSSTTPFTFNGARFASWGSGNQIRDDGGSSGTITIQGYRDGTLVDEYSITAALSVTSFDWVSTQFINIDELKFYAAQQTSWWLMDNFTYNEPVITPEPLTATLLGISLLGLASLRRRLS